MSNESDFRLSFYREIKEINAEHHVTLVQGVEDGVLYVKKLVTTYDEAVYKILAQNIFPHIPKIREIVSCDEGMVVIEEYVNGKNLEQMIVERPFTEEETRDIIRQLCEILRPLHEHDPRIIHRDIKPPNLILTAGGTLYLVDFNASKDYEPGKKRDTVLMGTAEYAAPEQYGFSQSSEKTDIYSIGVLMNKMLTGRFPAEEPYAGALSRVIKKCLSMDPGKRYRSVQALEAAVSGGRRRVAGSWVIPGFRTRKPWKMALAVTWYIFWGAAIYDIKIEDTHGGYYTGNMQLLVEFAMYLMVYGLTFYLCDYHGFRDHFPFRRTGRIWLDLLRIALGCSLILVLPLVMVVFADPGL